MAVRHGYGKIAGTDALVFAYDTSDIDNSFKGAPGQNFAYGPARNNNGYNLSTYSNGKLTESNGYTEVVNIPGLGLRSVETTEYYNVYSSYGEDGNYNCCPTLFVYAPGGWLTAVWESSTTYTYQIIYRSTSGYTHPNYMYRYEYNSSGSYLTEAGVHTTSQRTHLGDGWYHAWNTFTTQPGAAQGYTGMWHYEYNTRNKVSVAAVSITKGTTVRPPKQFIDEGTTRTATQGLLDLTGNNTLDISNISFNSNAQLIFDGTDDGIDVGNSSILSLANGIGTVEAIVKFPSSWTAGSQYPNLISKGATAGWDIDGWSLFGFRDYGGSKTWGFGMRNGPTVRTTFRYNCPSDVYLHIVATIDGSTIKLYENGGLYTTNSQTINPANNSTRVYIGRDASSERFNGEIPVAKIYNRALTANEILNNYNHYKARYNM